MKPLQYLFRSFLIIGLAFFFSCCSSDEFVLTEKNSTLTQRQNLVNPFDKTGVLYKQLFDAYQLIPSDSIFSINQIILEVEQTAAQIAGFSEIQDTYTPIDSLIIENIIYDQSFTVEDYILNSELSGTAQNLFLLLLDNTANNTKDEVYNVLVNFEQSVIQHSNLSDLDKEIMLTSCSILRYNLDNGGDTDWDDDKNSIIKSTLVGMQENTAKAIIMAVVVQVAVQQQVAIDLQN